MSELLLGAIADDYTGAADLAGMLRSRGVRTVLCLTEDALAAAAEHGYVAAVLALKTRSVRKDDARRLSREALKRLRDFGARQIFFKYCSTFDSSSEGNIGPVAEALMDDLQVPFTVFVPALPVNGRTQYGGHLFVDDVLLSESHMRHHPIHPMTDSNLVRHLQTQSSRKVGLIAHRHVREGRGSIRREADRLAGDGVAMALVDALVEEDLLEIAEAFGDLPLLTGGSGLAAALAEVWIRHGLVSPSYSSSKRARDDGAVLILSGSCSDATIRQLHEVQESHGDGVRMDVLRLMDDRECEIARLYEAVVASVDRRGWALAYSTAGPAEREDLSAQTVNRGRSAAHLGRSIESAHSELARRVVAGGVVRRLVVAGGETAGAVATSLGLGALEIEEELDPGVPLMREVDGSGLIVTFKSGNFGSADFFSKALQRLGAIHTNSST